MKRDLHTLSAINLDEQNSWLREHQTYQNDVRQPSFVERTIRALPKAIKAKMANHVLRGIVYSCSKITPAGNRWWTIRDATGKHLGGCGGRLLVECVPRVQAELERRDGLLPEEREAPQTQLGKQLGPKAGLVRRAR